MANLTLLPQLLFLAAFSASISLILRVALDWYPFTPTNTHDEQWMSWRDLCRVVLAGVFLFVGPFCYLIWAVTAIAKSGIVVSTDLPSVRQAVDTLSIILLPVALLGLYDIWQCIVRTWPTIFYTPHGRTLIENRHGTAFSSGRLQTFLLGIFWIGFPVALFVRATSG